MNDKSHSPEHMRIVMILTFGVFLPLLEHLLADRIIFVHTFSSFTNRFDHLCILVGFISVERLQQEFLC